MKMDHEGNTKKPKRSASSVTGKAVCIEEMDYEENTKRQKLSGSTVTAGNTSSASASASSPASVSEGNYYEVFLSFRGPETRKKFADYIYEDLIGRGIRTFRDSEKLYIGEEIGPELLKAINESKIFIPILSKDYASSKWCLRELAQSVECRKTRGQKIIPIFYDVNVCDLKDQSKGSYEMAFLQHSKDFDEETVKKWKEAMRMVGKLSGFELKKSTDCYEGKLAKMVLQEVLTELKKNYMYVTENLVGIDHHVEVMMGLLNVDDNNGACIVGIHGMGGIGKTTIAKVIYNQLLERFQCCCFLVDVREASLKSEGLVNLQNKLIREFLHVEDHSIVNLDRGKNMIENMVGRNKVLIVLDDVDKKTQFDDLVGKLDWFSSGSRIIVTTRNKEVLNQLEVNRIYEPPLMEPHYSLQLFCKHAFRRDLPPEDYSSISGEIVSTAGGLPLALEIIGLSLATVQEKREWEEILLKRKEIPDDEIHKKLIVSIKALNDHQRKIFLDVACFLIGVDKGIAFYMWDDCKLYPISGIKGLELKSLVKIGDNNELRMHDQLKLLGREIVRQEGSNDLGERSRFWSYEEALDILVNRMGTKRVEALCLDLEGESYGDPFTNKASKKLPNLRFLKVGYRDLAGDFKNLLSNLKWLHWHNWQGNHMLANLHLKNLVILNLSYSCNTHDWEAWSQIKIGEGLKVLDLSYCSGVTSIPEFCTFSTLERLILKGCRNMVQIDQSIENLKNLRVLDIAGSGITNLPDVIGNLEKLEEIKASGSLLGKIPSNIGRLSSLRILRLDSTKICSLSTSIWGLSQLEILDLMTCEELRLLPEFPPSLMSQCGTCKTFPSLANLMNLRELAFSECLNVVEILRDIGKLSKLKTLTFYKSSICTLPMEIGALSQLKQFKVQSCKNLQCVPGLPSSLFKLCLEDCESMERLPDLSNLQNLSELMLVKCSQLMEIRGLGNLESLESLDVSFCAKLSELDGLEWLKSLRCLITSGCESLERLPVLSNLKKLQKLATMGCKKLTKIPGLDRLEFLQYLNVDWCISMEKLPDLSNLGILKELTLCRCQKLVEVEGLRVLKSLQRLDVSYCLSLERLLLDLSDLKILKELKIHGWNDLTKIHGLKELKHLKLLGISDSSQLKNFQILEAEILVHSEEPKDWTECLLQQAI